MIPQIVVSIRVEENDFIITHFRIYSFGHHIWHCACGFEDYCEENKPYVEGLKPFIMKYYVIKEFYNGSTRITNPNISG